MNITLASKQGKSKNIARLVDSVSQLENVLNKRELKITRQGLKKNNWVDLSNLDEKRFVILLVKNKPEQIEDWDVNFMVKLKPLHLSITLITLIPYWSF